MVKNNKRMIDDPLNVFNKTCEEIPDNNLKLYLVDIQTISNEFGYVNDYQYDKYSNITDDFNSNTPLLYFIFCVDENGTKYALQINNFYGNVYIEVPLQFTENDCFELINHFVTYGENVIMPKYEIIMGTHYLGYEPKSDTDYSQRLYKYIVVKSPNQSYSQKIYDFFAEIHKIETIYDGAPIYYNVYQHSEDVILKFIGQTKTRPCGWFIVKNYTLSQKFYTHSQVEICCDYKELYPIKGDSSPAPLLVTSFDIETDNPTGRINMIENNIICISCYTNYSTGELNNGQIVTFIYEKDFDQDTVNQNKERLQNIKGNIIIDDPKGTIRRYKSEIEMLKGFRDYIVYFTNPDIITGYNTEKFDFKYIATRMAILSGVSKVEITKKRTRNGEAITRELNERKFTYIKNEYNTNNANKYMLHNKELLNRIKYHIKNNDRNNLFKFSRFINEITPLAKVKKKSLYTYSIISTGRILIDLYIIALLRPEKLSNLKLNNVAKIFIKREKEELDSKYIHIFYRAQAYNDIITYCETDAILPYELMICKSLQVILFSTQNAYEFAMPLEKVINGTSTNIITYSNFIVLQENNIIINLYDNVERYDLAYKGKKEMLHHPKSRELCYDLYPAEFPSPSRRMMLELMKNRWDKKTKKKYKPNYDGGFVHDPKPGIYYQPVATLDFNSLYPSIMIQFNICYTTIVTRDCYKNLPNMKYHKIKIDADPEKKIEEHEIVFVTKETLKGFTPSELERFLKLRSESKKMITKLELDAINNNTPLDINMKSFYDAKEKACKLINNTRYGLFATIGKFYVLELAEAVTYYGRTIIKRSAAYIKEKFKQYNPDIINGDTDSIMVLPSLPESKSSIIKLSIIADEMAEAITSTLEGVLRFENEKILYPYIVPNVKKKSMYIKYEKKATTKTLGYDIALEELDNLSDEKCDEIIDKLFKITPHSTGMCDKKRGTPKYLLDLTEKIQKDLLINKNNENVIRNIYETALKIKNEQIPIDDYISIKKIGTEFTENISANEYHYFTSIKRENRAKGTGYTSGDLVPFIVLDMNSAKRCAPDLFETSSIASKKSSKAEDPDYVKEYNENNEEKLSIDKDYYIDQIQTEFKPILELILKNTTKFFEVLKTSVGDKKKQNTLNKQDFDIEKFIKYNIKSENSISRKTQSKQTNLLGMIRRKNNSYNDYNEVKEKVDNQIKNANINKSKNSNFKQTKLI